MVRLVPGELQPRKKLLLGCCPVSFYHPSIQSMSKASFVFQRHDRPDPSLHPTCYSRLRSLPQAGGLERRADRKVARRGP
jgi:hypothetical protein